jgi:hypothetical protein
MLQEEIFTACGSTLGGKKRCVKCGKYVTFVSHSILIVNSRTVLHGTIRMLASVFSKCVSVVCVCGFHYSILESSLVRSQNKFELLARSTFGLAGPRAKSWC